ncbi:MAG: hypothetical protein KC468_30230, partial [Myxococcales bacterium]|nr:hypothetical protein [Myxococcales bacterium]
MQQSLLRDLERRAEQLRHKSILLRLARDEPTGYGLEFFGDDDELWDALGTPLTGCPFERRRGVVLSQAARVIEPSRAAPSSPRCAPRFARPPAGRRATLRRLAFGTLLPALACPGCSSSVEGRSSDPEQADESTTEETTGIGGFNTVTTAPSPGSFGDAGDTSDTSDTSTSTAETSADATTGSPPDVTPPVLENLRVNWSADPDPITQPGPVDVRVDATDSDTGIDRVEFSHNKDGAPFA